MAEVKFMGLTQILNVVLIFFLGSETDTPWYLIVPQILFLVGMWGVFRKSGLKPWHALIPCLQEIGLGQAAGME